MHAGLVVASVGLGVAYLVAPPGTRTMIDLLGALVAIASFVAALVARHLTDRWPWITATAGLVLLTLAMVFWPDWITGHHLGRAAVSPAALFIAAAHTLFFVGAGGALRRHAQNDPGGLLDARCSQARRK